MTEGDDVVATLALGEGGHGGDDAAAGLGDEPARDLDALAGRDHVVVDHDVQAIDGLDLIGAEEEVLCFSGGPAGAADLRGGRLHEVLLVLAGEDGGQVRLTSEDVEEALHLAAVRADDDLHARRHLLCECLADELVDLPLARRVEERDGHLGGHARDREDELPVDPLDRQVHRVEDRDAEGLGERLGEDRSPRLLASGEEAVRVGLVAAVVLGDDRAHRGGLETEQLRLEEHLHGEDDGLAPDRDDVPVGADHGDPGEVLAAPVDELDAVLDADPVAVRVGSLCLERAIDRALERLVVAERLLVDAGLGVLGAQGEVAGDDGLGRVAARTLLEAVLRAEREGDVLLHVQSTFFLLFQIRG